MRGRGRIGDTYSRCSTERRVKESYRHSVSVGYSITMNKSKLTANKNNESSGSTRRSVLQAATTLGSLLLGTTASGNSKGAMMDTPTASEGPFRPVFHFAPSEGWMNDPNGMVYHDGVYHLFYQAGAERRRWDHATSETLVSWEEHGTKIPAERRQAYSGGAVVDTEDTAGFGHDALVATYTGHWDDGVEDQRLAFSSDGGETLVEYENSPVVPSDVGDFRDPNPFWYPPDESWRMVVARVKSTSDRPAGIEIYGSSDLRDWAYLDTYESGGQSWECPSLYRVPVSGTDRHRWILTVSVDWNHVEHHVGHFDGAAFSVNQRVHADHGFDFYGGQTWANTPERPGLLLSWMNNWEYADQLPDTGWQGAQSIPREVTLVETDGGIELRQHPAEEVTSIRGRKLASLSNERITPDYDPLASSDVAGQTIEIQASIAPGGAEWVELAVRESAPERTKVVYDVSERELIVDRGQSGAFFGPDRYAIETGPLPLVDGSIELRVLVDRSSIEVFANDGRYTNTNLIFPEPTSTGVSLTTRGGSAELRELTAYEVSTGDER